MPKETPEKIDRYILGKALGSGSHGTVWQAEDSLLGRTVALKLLKDETDGGKGLDKSLQEARTLAKLNHPNIVTLYEVSEHEGQAYLVMEYLDGAPLNDFLANSENPPTFDDKVSMAKQLVDALATAHENGIVHADIKPANILVRADGCPVLVDFGLAKVINASTDLETVTDDSLLNTMVHGTLSYMAPEVMRGDAADEKSDIFSLGAVFYEMFNGERAFKAPSDAETIHLILNIDPTPTTSEANQIPAWLSTIIANMLAKKHEERASSFTELQTAFNDPASRTSAEQKNKHKKRLILGPALAVSLALSIFGATQYDWQEPSVSGQINAGLEKLRNFQEKGAIADAKAHFQAVLSEDPENAAATAGYSLALMSEYADEESDPSILNAAVAAANLAISLDNQLALSHTAMALSFEHQGKLQNAKASYLSAITLDPSGFLNFEAYGRFLTSQGNYDEAITIYEDAITIYPNVSAFYTGIGDNYRRLSKYDKAEPALLKAIELSPDSVFAYLTLSAVQYAKGDLLAAIKTAQRGIQIRPHPRLYGNLGTFYFTLGQYAQSINAFERAIDVSGNSHNYLQWANLADAYRMMPETKEKSKTAYKRAIQLLNDRMSVNDTRPTYVSRASLYLAKAGELTEAETMANRAIELAPDDSSVLFRSAVVYDLIGNRPLALSLLEQSLKNGYPLSAIKSEPDLTKLRNDPLYHQLLVRRESS